MKTLSELKSQLYNHIFPKISRFKLTKIQLMLIFNSIPPSFKIDSAKLKLSVDGFSI